MRAHLLKRAAAGVTALTVAGVAVTADAAPAHAADATVTLVDGVLTFRAAAGQANDLSLTAAMEGITYVSDTNVRLSAGAGCRQFQQTQVSWDGRQRSPVRRGAARAGRVRSGRPPELRRRRRHRLRLRGRGHLDAAVRVQLLTSRPGPARSRTG